MKGAMLETKQATLPRKFHDIYKFTNDDVVDSQFA